MEQPDVYLLNWHYFAVYGGAFSPDDATLMLNYSLGDKRKIMMFDAQSGRLMWQRINARGDWFSADGTSVLCNLGAAEHPHCLDAATGCVQTALAPNDYRPCLTGATADGRRVLIHGTYDPFQPAPAWQQWLGRFRPQWLVAPPGGLMVTQPATGRELLRLSAWESSGTLSKDGCSLVIWPWPGSFLTAPHAARRVEVWDVDPDRANFWGIAWPLSLGIILLLLRRSRLTRKTSA